MSNEFVEELRLTAKDEASGTLGGLSERLSEYSRRLFDLSGLLGSLGSTLSFGALIKSGIEFNSTMETTRGGIAALILSSNEFRDSQGRLVTGQGAVNAAFTAASSVQSKLVEDAKRTAASYQDLVGAFQTAYGPATAAGITNLDKLRQVTVGVSQAVTALGLDSRQLSQEIRAIFTGEQGPDNTLNRVLGITKQQLDAVRRSGGDVGDYILTKLKPFMDAAAQASDNLSVRASNLKDSFQQMAGEVSQPIFDVLKSAVTQASGALGDAKERLMGMGATAARVLQDLLPLGESLVRLGIVAFDAGLKFLDGLSPVVPLLTGLANGIAYVLDVMGPWAPGIYVTVAALQSLWTAIAALTAAGGVASLGAALTGLFNPITAAGVALGGLVLAYRAWKTEADSATKAVENSQAGLIKQFGEIEDRALKLGKTGLAEWAGDWAKKISEGTVSLGDGSTALHNYAKSHDVVTAAAVAAGSAITMTAKTPPLSPEQIVAIGKLATEYAKLTKGIEDQIKLLRTPEAQRPFEKLRESAVRDIAEIKLKFGDSSEAIRARWTLLTLQLQEEARKFAAAYKAVPVEVQTGLEGVTPVVLKEVEKWTGTVIKGVAEISTLTKRFISDLSRDAGQAFDEGLVAVFSGKIGDLGDVFENFGKNAVKTMSLYFADIVKEWVSTKSKLQINADGSIMGGSAGSTDGVWGSQSGAYQAAGYGAAAGYFGSATGGAASFGQGFAPYLSTAASVAAIGAAAGVASPISIVAYVVAAVIAVIGLIVNLVAPDTEKHILLRGKDLLAKGEAKDKFGGAIQGTVENFQRFGASLADIAGLDSGSRRSMAEAINKGLLEYVDNMNWEVHAGSEDDLKADVQNLLSGVIPSEMLHRLFGNIQLGGQDLPGISGGTKYGQGIADQNAPITKFLKDLGFTIEAIGTLSTRIDSMEPEKFMEYLKGLVGVVVGFGDLAKKFRASTWGEFQDVLAQRAADADPLKQFTQGAQNLKDLGAELNLYTGDEKVRRAAELNQLGQQYYESMVSYMASLKSLADGINKSITDQVKGLQYGLLDDGGKTSFLNKEIQDLYGKLQNESDPTKVAALVQQIQQDIGLLSGLGGNAKNQIFVDWATQLLNSVNAFAQSAITRKGGEVAALNSQYGLDKFFESLKKDFTTFSQGFSDLGDPDKRPVRDLDELGSRAADAAYNTEQLGKRSGEAAASVENFSGWLAYGSSQVKAFVEALAMGAGGGGGDAIETLRRNPYAAARKTGR